MSNSPTFAVTKPVAIASFAGVLGILLLNVALVIQNRTLKKQMAAPPPLLAQVGTRVEELEGVALNGSEIKVSFADQNERTLLFVFSTRCGVCGLNWPQWQSIARSLQGRPLRVVYANVNSSLDLEYAEHYGIQNAIVYARLDPRYESALNLRLTPQTILIGQGGGVESVWPGLLNDQNVGDILKHLRYERNERR